MSTCHGCNSPGCSVKSTRFDGPKHCNSPGCTGGNSARYTQSYDRPADPVPFAGTDKRPNHSGKPAFSFVRMEASNDRHVLVLVQYPEVKKFHGLKLLIFSKPAWDKIDEHRIDPHFYPDGQTPLARFIPNREGVEAASRAYFDKSFDGSAFIRILTRTRLGE